MRTRLQFIFQDPISSLNPRRKVKDIVAEPLRIWKRGTDDGAEGARRRGARRRRPRPRRSPADKRPHQFSGGQCQRISIARSLVLEPKVIICDEPVSALDVSVQAQILNLLEDMKARYGLTLIFIAHDLAVVKNISDRVAVMYLGKICEVGAPDDLYATPAHPYTAALLRSIPVPDPTVPPVQSGLLTGDLPSPIDPPAGCRFRTRCPLAQERCADEEPQVRAVGDGHYVACHFPLLGRRRPGGHPGRGRHRRPLSPPAPQRPQRGIATERAPGHGVQAPLRLDPADPCARSSWRRPRRVPRAATRARSASRRSPRPAACRARSCTPTSAIAAGLIAAVYLHNLEQLDRELGRALDDRLPDEVRLRRIIRRYLVFARDNEAAWNVMAAAGALQHPAIQAARRERIERIAGAWGGRPPSARLVARGVVGLLEAGAQDWVDYRDSGLERATDVLFAVLWEGLTGLARPRHRRRQLSRSDRRRARGLEQRPRAARGRR